MRTNDKITEGGPFKVPENYFEELNGRIISSTVGTEGITRNKSLYIRLRNYLAIAASVAVLVILSYTGIKLFSTKNESVSLSSIPIENFTEAILEDIDLLTLEENLIVPEEIQNDNQINQNEIIEYLIQDNIDISEIQDQL
jgi:hypothetical protein